MTDNHHPVALDGRALLCVSGPDAEHFLQNIITTDVGQIGKGDMLPGALLSPQGKMLFDFLIGRRNGVFYLDIRSAAAGSFIKRLALYRLRANFAIHEENHVLTYVFLNNRGPAEGRHSDNADNLLIFKDKRFGKDSNIVRVHDLKKQLQPVVNERQKWDIIRIENGIAESGADFEPGDVFPQDINYDQINAISFKKGCYIGQEVVSRMQHRATARKRIVVATANRAMPPAGSVIEADGKPVGLLGTVVETKAIALARVDRISAMTAAGFPVTAGGVELAFAAPANVRFSLSDAPSARIKADGQGRLQRD